MTPLALAKKLIRHAVERGDSVDDIQRTWMGQGHKGNWVSVGGHIHCAEWYELIALEPRPDDYFERLEALPKSIKVPSSKILVSEVNGALVNQVFSLTEVYRLIQLEKEQRPLPI